MLLFFLVHLILGYKKSLHKILQQWRCLKINQIAFSIFTHKIKGTYRSWIRIVGNLIPRGNEDPLSIEVYGWKVDIDVLCGLLEDTARSELVVVDLTVISVVKICPEWSNDVCGLVQWDPLRRICTQCTVKCQVPIVVHL